MKTIDGVDEPLTEWTASEIQEFCHDYNSKISKITNARCETSCPIREKICSQGWVYDWDLSEKPKFTEQEVQVAKAIKLIFGSCSLIKDEQYDKIRVLCGSFSCSSIKTSLFPSLENMKAYSIDEIIGGADA